jgi:hypothetical protein
MRALATSVLVLSIVSIASSAAAPIQAPSANVKTMAAVLAKLNHFPNDAEKATLNEIVKSDKATAHEKTIAQALVNTQHAATAADKPKLEAILKDKSATDAERSLAEILARLNHSPSAADKASLTKLAGK